MVSTSAVEPTRRTAVANGYPILTIKSDLFPGKTVEVQQQSSDIDACISFSFIRCVLSMLGIGLVLTDIPRTGLFVNVPNYFPKVGVDTTMTYGPYAYPNIHLNQTLVFGDTRNDGIDVWPYKYDSVSIPTRALAEYLNVTSYPPCILYRERCKTSTLGLTTVFTMLNDLIAAIDNNYFTQEELRYVPFVFYSTSNWIDRLHHVILGKFGRRIDARIHAVYRFGVTKNVGLNVCEQKSAAESHHSLVCKSPVEWRCDHPFHGGEQQVTVAESIQLRVAKLQDQYPDAELDVTMITTRNELKSHHTFLPSVFYRCDNTEITTFIRGRDCQSSYPCKTVFIDDYRYERGLFEMSSDTFRTVASILRGVSQLYVWVRIVLLLFVCYRTRVAEVKYPKKSLMLHHTVVFMTLAKIPSQSIIYTSWFPIIGYSIAHFVDCGLTHFIGDTFWATSNGFLTFDLVKYIQVSTVQMRNIWIIALVWKCAILLCNRFITTHKHHWQPQHGLFVFRGLFITMTSSLTMFTFLRALHFRDTRVLSFHEVQRNRGARSAFFGSCLQTNSSDFGYSSDFKSTSIAVTIVVGSFLLLRKPFGLSRKALSRTFFCHTYYVPLSTGVLFPTSALTPLWYMELRRDQDLKPLRQQQPPNPALVSAIPPRLVGAVAPLIVGARQQLCETCDFVASPLHWRAVQGCRKHETLFEIGQRSVQTQSMVRLMHIGVFSDPIVFFQLCVLGKQMYVYRIRDRNQRKLSPNTEDINGTMFLSPIRLTNNEDSCTDEYELVTCVSSTSVPWTYLVDCG